jgi:hypothetical protein
MLLFSPGLLYYLLMKLNQNPSFRRVVIPWYDSDLFRLLISVFTALVFCFSTIGVSVGLKNEQYHEHCWVPLLLMVLSGIVLAVNLIRILTGIVNRHAEEQ